MKSTLLFLLAGVLGVALGFGTLKAKTESQKFLTVLALPSSTSTPL